MNEWKISLSICAYWNNKFNSRLATKSDCAMLNYETKRCSDRFLC